MRVLLCALNAKYIHSNLAVHYLREYARFSFDVHVEIEEYTINQHFHEVLRDIYKKKPDLIGFSCYIWNISYVERLIVELKKILPETKLWLGGPEVSYHATEVLKKYPQLSGIVKGEGEEAFAKILEFQAYQKNPKEIYKETDKESQKRGYEKTFEENYMEDILGIVYRDEKGEIKETPRVNHIELDSLPFPYKDLSSLENRILYYESSRGCPYSCSYCLSSAESKVRFKTLDRVKEDLKVLINNHVAQVKFVDRTFNCDGRRAREIWKFIQDHDNGKTNFHFEIAGDLLGEEDFELLGTFRQGLVQFEIGVQSTNPVTLKEINRVMDFSLVKRAVSRLKESQNIHLHLDLIAGLPKEDRNSFVESFDQTYQLKAEHLQLGFLKLLKGSLMDNNKETYGLVVQEHPPYEVLATKWLDFNEILRIKTIEEMVEVYYNSGQFRYSIDWLEKHFSSPFCLYESLGDFYDTKGDATHSHSRERRYEIILEFVKSSAFSGNNEDVHLKVEEFRQRLILDFYLRENPKKRPVFAGDEQLTKEEKEAFYKRESMEFRYLKGYETFDKRKIKKMTHLERINGEVYLFDYLNKNTWKQQGKIHIIKEALR